MARINNNRMILPAVFGLLLGAAPLWAQPGAPPGAMPGQSFNGSQPGGSGSQVGPGLSGYSPSYGVPGTGGYGSQAGAGMPNAGPAQPYRVPGETGNGASSAMGLGSAGRFYGGGYGYGSGTTGAGTRGLSNPNQGGGGSFFGSTSIGAYAPGAGGGTNRFGRPMTLDNDIAAPKAAANQEEESVAQVRVLLPDSKAVLFANDVKTRKKGTDRSFLSPILRPGKEFVYDFQAQWTDKNGKVVHQTRSVRVHAGSHHVVDFTRPESEQTASRDDR